MSHALLIMIVPPRAYIIWIPLLPVRRISTMANVRQGSWRVLTLRIVKGEGAGEGGTGAS